MSIDGAKFFIREENTSKGQFSPERIGGVTNIINLFVADPYGTVAGAVAAGAKILIPVTDYAETGYCEGIIDDPFGHRWSILKPLEKQTK